MLASGAAARKRRITSLKVALYSSAVHFGLVEHVGNSEHTLAGPDAQLTVRDDLHWLITLSSYQDTGSS